MITRIRRYRLDNVQAQPAKALLIDGRTASTKRLSIRLRVGSSLHSGQDTARGELKWQNIDADDLPAEVKKSFDAMVEAEATFKANFGKAAEERRSHARGQVPGYEPQGKTSWGRVCEHATR